MREPTRILGGFRGMESVVYAFVAGFVALSLLGAGIGVIVRGPLSGVFLLAGAVVAAVLTVQLGLARVELGPNELVVRQPWARPSHFPLSEVADVYVTEARPIAVPAPRRLYRTALIVQLRSDRTVTPWALRRHGTLAKSGVWAEPANVRAARLIKQALAGPAKA